MKQDTANDLYLSATVAIIRKCASLRNEARRNPIYDADMVDRVVRLANRTEAKELRDAREKYECVVETVRTLLAAE